MEHIVIPVLSAAWSWGLLAGCSFVAAMLFVAGRLSAGTLDIVCRWYGLLILADILLTDVYLGIVTGTWTLRDSLPFHLCGVELIVAGIAPLTRSRQLYEFLAYVGIPSGLVFLLLPTLTRGDSAWLWFESYFAHSSLILVPLLLTMQGRRPRRGAAWRVFANIQGLGLLVLPLDVLADANYMYLIHKPKAVGTWLPGDWPWYLLVMDLAALVLLAAVELAFRWFAVTGQAEAAAAQRGQHAHALFDPARFVANPPADP